MSDISGSRHVLNKAVRVVTIMLKHISGKFPTSTLPNYTDQGYHGTQTDVQIGLRPIQC